MYFSETNRTIIEPHIGNSFQLSPPALSKSLLKYWENANLTIDRDCLNLRDVTDDFNHVKPGGDRVLCLDSGGIIMPGSTQFSLSWVARSLQSLTNIFHANFTELLRHSDA